MMALENYHLATTTVIIASGKIHQGKLKLMGKEEDDKQDTYTISKYLPIKFTEKVKFSNYTMENPGRYHFIQVIKGDKQHH